MPFLHKGEAKGGTACGRGGTQEGAAERRRGIFIKAHEIDGLLDEQTSCISFFGGDPSCQMPFAISLSRLALKARGGRILRICFETNGSMSEGLSDQAFELCLQSGGCMKYDLKAWDEIFHLVLTGTTRERTLRNFARLAEKVRQRPDPPPLVASTLIVPGYIDEEEIRGLSRFIARLDPEIPYTLLAFYPHFYMRDLPLVDRAFALRLRETALEEGLENVRIGNAHLLR